MADKNLYLRSLTDKGETTYNLRLRSDDDKIAAPAGWANIKNIRAGTGTILATDLGSIWYGTGEALVADHAELGGVAV